MEEILQWHLYKNIGDMTQVRYLQYWTDNLDHWKGKFKPSPCVEFLNSAWLINVRYWTSMRSVLGSYFFASSFVDQAALEVRKLAKNEDQYPPIWTTHVQLHPVNNFSYLISVMWLWCLLFMSSEQIVYRTMIFVTLWGRKNPLIRTLYSRHSNVLTKMVMDL